MAVLSVYSKIRFSPVEWWIILLALKYYLFDIFVLQATGLATVFVAYSRANEAKAALQSRLASTGVAPWPQLGYDAHGSYRSPYPGPVQPDKWCFLWSADQPKSSTGLWLGHRLLIGKEGIFLGNNFYYRNGTRISTPLYARTLSPDGKIVFTRHHVRSSQQAFTNLGAYNVSDFLKNDTSSPLWTKNVPDFTDEIIDLETGTVFLLEGFELQAINAITGAMIWKYEANKSHQIGKVLISPLAEKYIVVEMKSLNETPYIAALNFTTGEVVWAYEDASFSVDTVITLTAVTRDGKVLIDAQLGDEHFGEYQLIAINAITAVELYRFRWSDRLKEDLGPAINSVWGEKDILYVLKDAKTAVRVIAMNTTSSETKLVAYDQASLMSSSNKVMMLQRRANTEHHEDLTIFQTPSLSKTNQIDKTVVCNLFEGGQLGFFDEKMALDLDGVLYLATDFKLYAVKVSGNCNTCTNYPSPDPPIPFKVDLKTAAIFGGVGLFLLLFTIGMCIWVVVRKNSKKAKYEEIKDGEDGKTKSKSKHLLNVNDIDGNADVAPYSPAYIKGAMLSDTASAATTTCATCVGTGSTVHHCDHCGGVGYTKLVLSDGIFVTKKVASTTY